MLDIDTLSMGEGRGGVNVYSVCIIISTVVVLAGNARAEAGRRSGAARPSNNPAVRRWSRWRADLASVDTSRHGQAMLCLAMLGNNR